MCSFFTNLAEPNKSFNLNTSQILTSNKLGLGMLFEKKVGSVKTSYENLDPKISNILLPSENY